MSVSAPAPGAAAPGAWVAERTAVVAPALCPELRLRAATEVTPLWEETEATLERAGVPPPYWAVPWVGGQALARYVLDHPRVVAGRDVLDAGAGSGCCAIAAALAGARRVRAVDVDPYAVAATRLNAALNGVTVETACADVTAAPAAGPDVVLAGDLWYERDLAERVTRWLRAAAAAGAEVLLGDLGRAHFPRREARVLAWYDVPGGGDVEAAASIASAAWRFGPEPEPAAGPGSRRPAAGLGGPVPIAARAPARAA